MKPLMKKWWKGIKGTTAVEFAMVGVPFILMTVGIVEMALIFTTQSVLQESTFTAARLIRTGQLQKSGGDQEQLFRDAVCDFASMLIPCNQIQFQVTEVPSFANADDNPAEFDDDGNLQDPGFDAGGASSVVVVRVVYNYPIFSPMMWPLLATRNGGLRTMMSTMVIETEPYK